MTELLEKHPKTAKLVRDYYTQRWLTSVEEAGNLPPDFLEFAKNFSLDNERINLILQDQPRGLFDFFDANNLHIWTKWTEKGWQSCIGKESTAKKFNERVECEKYGVSKAFGLLEETLSNDVGVSQSDTSDSGE
jgi:hypothetical protein